MDKLGFWVGMVVWMLLSLGSVYLVTENNLNAVWAVILGGTSWGFSDIVEKATNLIRYGE